MQLQVKKFKGTIWDPNHQHSIWEISNFEFLEILSLSLMPLFVVQPVAMMSPGAESLDKMGILLS